MTFESSNAGFYAQAGRATRTRRNPRASAFYHRYGKRLFDLALALALVPVLAPAIAVLWALSRCDGGSGFYAQTRIGRGGRAFRCLKIRTMKVGADTLLTHHLATDPKAQAEWQHCQKLSNDPRVTTFGRFLRITSLDELPQIWNVLRGDMSFVGPRPVPRSELHRYGPAREHYKSVRPGITGLWQLSGRNAVSYDERVTLDLAYLERANLWLDLSLILRTGRVLTTPTGH